MSRGLLVFARQPLPGSVKTRLAAELGDLAAARLYAAMLEDVLERVAALDDTRLLVFWAGEQGELPPCPSFPELEMFRQNGVTLGERMANAFESAFANGIRECCIIGSDSPDLPLEYIRTAFVELEQDRADVTFGPAEDGGYYLVGMRRVWRRLFEEVAWGGPRVLETSLERARELDLRTCLLAPWYDLDRLTDLRRLAAAPGRQAPRTRAALRAMTDVCDILKQAGAP